MPTAILQTGTTTAIVSTGTTTAIVITGDVVANGVILQGQHAVSDLRGLGADRPRRRHELLSLIPVKGQVGFADSRKVKAKLSTETSTKTSAKVIALHSVLSKAKVTSEAIKAKVRSRITHSDTVDAKSTTDSKPYADDLHERERADKLKKLKRLWDEYENDKE